MKNFGLFLLLASVLFSCSENPEKQLQRATIKHPKNGQIIRWNEKITFEWKNTPTQLDSARVYLKDKYITTGNTQAIEFVCPTTKVGPSIITVDLFANGEKVSSKKVQVKILSNQPETYGNYKIINTYPHDTTSYTQGLEFKDNILYESTGQYGKSDIRIVSLENGKPIKKTTVAPNFFAEGITILNNRLYQLTWQERVCFVYDPSDLSLINQLNYPSNIEGWGLTHIDEKLLLSDGTEKLYYLNPTDLSILSSVSVYNFKGNPIKNINELEIVNNKVLANIYTTNYIVEIDPLTGAIEKTYDLSGLLKKEDISLSTDVLNGIAYNPLTNKLYVTGKNWPKLFEIELF